MGLYGGRMGLYGGVCMGVCMGVETAATSATSARPLGRTSHWAPARSLECQPQEALVVSCGVTKTENGGVTYVVGCRERRRHLRSGL